MKVYVQIGTSKEKVDFDLKLSDTIKTLKAKIAEDRGIPVCIQRLFHKYQEDLEDQKKTGIRDEIKLSQIMKMNDTIESEIYSSKESKAKVSKKDYLCLYLYGYLEIKVRTFGGHEFSIDHKSLDNNRIGDLKWTIFKVKGYPRGLQKLYLGDARLGIMTELENLEYILSPQIIEKLRDHGLILEVSGEIPLRNIAMSADNTVYYPKIDAMDTIANIKRKIVLQGICKSIHLLYLDGNDIQTLEDEKRLCDYSLSNLLDFGLLMKPKYIQVFVKDHHFKIHTLVCYPEDRVPDFFAKVAQRIEVPSDKFYLHYNGRIIENYHHTTLKEKKIDNLSTVQVNLRHRSFAKQPPIPCSLWH